MHYSPTTPPPLPTENFWIHPWDGKECLTVQLLWGRVLYEAQALRESTEDLCRTQEHAVPRSLGIDNNTGDISDDSVSESDQITEIPSELSGVSNNFFPSEEELNETLSKSEYNCFEVVANSLARLLLLNRLMTITPVSLHQKCLIVSSVDSSSNHTMIL